MTKVAGLRPFYMMNPPFSDADKHLLKALELQKRGGSIICLLNAETIRNPYTNTRKQLVKTLEANNAEIQYLQKTFSHAERKTDVEIALVKIHIPEEERESDIYEHLKKARNYEDVETTATQITFSDYIKNAVAHFNLEIEAGIELIRQYKSMLPYLQNSLDENNNYKKPILELKVSNDYLTVNNYVKAVRLKYWEELFRNPQFTSKLTSKLADEYSRKITELKEYDFSEYNINYLIADMNANIQRGVEESIMELFDKMTAEHSWYPECRDNIHYYNGWATNKAHKINSKVILPIYTSGWDGVFNEDYCSKQKKFQARGGYNALADIEKVLNSLDGHMTAEVNLSFLMEQAEREQRTKNIHCKFFDVTFYKKGTMHIKFTNLELLEKFNIFAARNRNWLPPNYGKAKYQDMTAEEKAVVDDFQGEKAYEHIMQKKDYYITESGLDMIETCGAA